MIRGVIIGSEAIAAHFNKIETQAMPKLAVRIQKVTLLLQAKVIRDKLSGQVLRVRSNNLRSSIHQSVTVGGQTITGIVGTNVEYAAYHEYGLKGTQNVKAHLRTIKMAFGNALKQPKIVSIRAHTREVSYPEKSFIRSAMADMKDEIMVTITEGMKEAIK